jgi:hypothetical protein
LCEENDEQGQWWGTEEKLKKREKVRGKNGKVRRNLARRIL